MESDKIEEQVIEYKVYKEKPYLNSNKEPFGLTIYGKSKEYVAAHETLKDIMKKYKIYKTKSGDVRVLDTTNEKGLFVATIEVCDIKTPKGQAQLKIHAPGKKGASIELRKLSGYEYMHVEVLKSVITTFLDGFIDGEELPEILKKGGNGSIGKARVTSKPTRFTCDLCNFESKLASGLKTHKTRIHPQKVDFKCQGCDFVASTEKSMNLHRESDHTQIITLKCQQCDQTIDDEKAMDLHVANMHKQSNKREISISPSSSPPRKKIGKHFENEENEVEMIDLEIEANDMVYSMLENRIKHLENLI